MDHEQLRDVALEAAHAGAEVVRAGIDGDDRLKVTTKSEGDYVTAVDVAAEKAVLAVLARRTPEIAILAEETGGQMSDSGRLWVVDPLDGTTNFLRGYSSAVGVSVGLLEEGQPVAAAVAAPALHQVWSAARGAGARDGRGRPLAVRDDGGRGVTVTGLPFRRRELLSRYLPVLDRAIATMEDIRRLGSAALDCCHVAAGVWDGYFELNLGPWDLAAGILLVREAGGVVTDWDGDPDGPLRSGDVLAGGPTWHRRMLELIQTASPPAP